MFFAEYSKEGSQNPCCRISIIPIYRNNSLAGQGTVTFYVSIVMFLYVMEESSPSELIESSLHLQHLKQFIIPIPPDTFIGDPYRLSLRVIFIKTNLPHAAQTGQLIEPAKCNTNNPFRMVPA